MNRIAHLPSPRHGGRPHPGRPPEDSCRSASISAARTAVRRVRTNPRPPETLENDALLPRQPTHAAGEGCTEVDRDGLHPVSRTRRSNEPALESPIEPNHRRNHGEMGIALTPRGSIPCHRMHLAHPLFRKVVLLSHGVIEGCSAGPMAGRRRHVLPVWRLVSGAGGKGLVSEGLVPAWLLGQPFATSAHRS